MLGIHRAEYAALQAWRVRKFIIAEHDTMSSRHGVNESSRAHMIMNLRHLRYFLVLCQELNFTRAARQCGISQPSLTNAIRTLERELGGPLFHRSPTCLTGFGRRVRPHLRRALVNIERAREVEGARRASRRRSVRR
jgi:hypothetical protein